MAYRVPMYQQLYDEIRSAIEDGAYAEGAQLPTEVQLMEEYGVSRVTVRHAVGLLCDAGYVERVRGSGTYVRRPQRMEAFRQQGSLQPFSVVCSRRGMKPGARLMGRDVRRALPQERAFLELDPGDNVLHLRRILLADGVPLVDEYVALPHRGFEAFETVSLDDSSLFAALERFVGRSPASVHHRTIEAVACTRDQGLPLKLDEGSPLLKLTTYCLDEIDRPLCVIRSFCVGERYLLAF